MASTGAVLITGAGGFVGRALVARLLAEGYRVIAVDVKEPDIAPVTSGQDNLVRAAASFDDYAHLADRMRTWGVRAVVHLAWAAPYGEGFSDGRLQLRNIFPALDLVESCAQAGVEKFVFVTTANQFEISRVVAQPSPRLRPTSVYGTCKLAADLLLKQKAQELGVSYCAAALAMVYGPGDCSNKLPNIVMSQLIAGKEPKLIEGKSPYDLVYIDDVALAILAIIERGKDAKSYYIGHRVLQTFRWWMECMKASVAPEVALRFGAFPDTGGIDYAYVRLEELFEDTGFECAADADESFRATAAWLKKEDPLGML